MDFPFGPIVSVIRTLRDAVLDRPNVDVLARVVDHGTPPPNVITPWIGVYAHLEVHATGRQPVRVTGVGLELADGSRVSFDSGQRLPATLTRPEPLDRRKALDTLRRDVAGRKVRRIFVTASPERVFYRPLPREWRRGVPGL